MTNLDTVGKEIIWRFFMKRRELFVTIKFSLGEAPDLLELKRSGITLQEYAESLVDEMNLGDLANEEIEINASTKVIEE